MLVRLQFILVLLSIPALSIFNVVSEQCGNEGDERVIPAANITNDTTHFIQVCYNDSGSLEWRHVCFDEGWDISAAIVFCQKLEHIGSRSNGIGSPINRTELKLKMIACTGKEGSLIECNSILTTDQCDFVPGVLDECNLQICSYDRRCLHSENCSFTEPSECGCKKECSNSLALTIGSSSAAVLVLILSILSIVCITVVIFNCVKRRNLSSFTSSTHSNRRYGTMPYENITVIPNRIENIDNSFDSIGTSSTERHISEKPTDLNDNGEVSTDSFEHFDSVPSVKYSPSHQSRSKHHTQSNKHTRVQPPSLHTESKASPNEDSDLYNSLFAGVVPGHLSTVTHPRHIWSGSYVINELTSSGKSYVEPPRDMKSLRISKTTAKEINKLNLKVEGRIAHGQFGTVYRAIYKTDEGLNIPVAVKTPRDKSNKGVEAAFRREALILDQFQHPNILKFIGFVNDSPYMIVTELLKTELGELLRKLKDTPVDKWNLPPLLIKFCIDIAAGMCYLAAMNFIHRDLAARNVLVAKDLSCRIADFGMSRQLKVDDSFYTSKGGQIPLRWSAPEAVFYNTYSEKSDVWSFGMTMYEIWALGEKPWPRSNNPQILKCLSDGVKHSPPTGCDREVYKVMLITWHTDQAQRPLFSQIFQKLCDIQLPPPTPQTAPIMVLGSDSRLATDLYKSLRF